MSSVPVPQTAEAGGGASNDFILNELNFEIKKLTAEFKHLSREMDDLRALSKMWINPLTIYSKEIILKNKTFPLIITYSPSYLIRFPESKKYSWEDLKKIKKRMQDLSVNF